MEPPDVIRRPCMGLPPGTPCPTHLWGTWPKDCICYQEGNYPMGRDRLTWIVIGIFFAVATILFTWIAIDLAFGADVDTSCMTKAQAATKYPRQWLYWHGAGHCWDNHAGHYISRVAVYGKQNSLKLPSPKPDANGNVAHHSGRPIETINETRPTIAYPALMSGSGTDDTMLQPQAMTDWPAIIDFDTEPPRFIPWQQRISFFVATENEGKP
jgi:hypothetical protein